MKKSKATMKKPMTGIILFTMILTIAAVSLDEAKALVITEIMYNPEGADTGREWIEIWSDDSQCYNLTQYKFFEEGTNHNIYMFSRDIFCGYAIITNNPETFLQGHPELDPIDTPIYKSSFSLSNSGETLALKQDAEIFDYVNYSMLLQYITVEEGYSLELDNITWKTSYSSGGSPGNHIYYDGSGWNDTLPDMNSSNTTGNSTSTDNSTYHMINESDDAHMPNSTNASINTSIYDINETSGENVTDIPITTELPDLADNTTQNVTYNITQIHNMTYNTTNDTDYATNKCGVSLKIRLKNESSGVPYINDNDVQIRFYNKLEFSNGSDSHNYSIEYWVEDISGNIVKSKMTTNNQDEKSFTPRIDESDRILYIKSYIKSIDCNITGPYAERMLLIKNSAYSPENCPACECECPKKSSSGSGSSSKAVNEQTVDEKTCKEICTKISATVPPITKIVNVCNGSGSDKPGTYNASILEESKTSLQSSQSGTAGIQALSDNNSKKRFDEGMTTGMIVYESPNIKNRFYAIVGFILVCLTLVTIIGYRLIAKKASRHGQD